MHFSPPHLLSFLASLGTTSALYMQSPRAWYTTHVAEASAYTLRDSYDASNFFNFFSFFNGGDPTHGYVSYVSQGTAQSAGMVHTSNNQIYMGVDASTPNPAGGRASVRVTSNKAYTHGLFVADIAHMPGGICGVWPAFWTFGPSWPNSGEIDILEGVNLQATNAVTLHTKAGCMINNDGSMPGTVTVGKDCGQDGGNTGCSTSNGNAGGYGAGFNANGGGVYAMQWESSGIYVWFFPRNAIPADINAGAPVTSNWGLPVVAFNGGSGCNIDSFFSNHNIIFDTTFCGDWAGAAGVWQKSECKNKAATCQDYVANNPSAFANAYWLINSVKVYQHS